MAEHRKPCLLVLSLVPVENEEEGSAPSPLDGGILAHEPVRPEDLIHRTEWLAAGERLALILENAVRLDGWPVLPRNPQGTVLDVEDRDISGKAAGVSGDPNRCPDCGALFVVTDRRGSFCPNGCGDPVANGRRMPEIPHDAPLDTDPNSDYQRMRRGEIPVRGLPGPAPVAAADLRLDRIERVLEAIVGRIGLDPDRQTTVEKPVEKPGMNLGENSPLISSRKGPQTYPQPKFGSGTAENPYESTPEDPRPTSFPQGEPLPTTD